MKKSRLKEIISIEIRRILENNDNSFVIEVRKNSRYFFIAEYENKYVLTWKKEFAKKFNNQKEALEFMKKNSLYYNDYKILNYSDAKNH